MGTRDPQSEVSEPFGSNAVRLSGREWGVALVLLAALVLAVPRIMQRLEVFRPSVDYRHPYSYGEDYWLYARYSRYAAAPYPVAVIGDSVIWGHYVEPEGTLTHFLNREAGGSLCANLGLDGTRPMALAGLVQYYCRDLRGKSVILHLNPLWMSSPDADLGPRAASPSSRGGSDEEKRPSINHTRLLPQLRSRPRGHDPNLDTVASVGLERYVPYAAWLRHLRMVYFGGLGIESWTLDHPYANPLSAVTLQLPQPEDRPESEPVPWTRGGIEKQDFPWVRLDQSYQWERFVRTADILQARGNRVFVLVGPMNTHLMTEGSRQRHERVRADMEARLRARRLPYCAPAALPSDLYADASHPLKAGYARLAEELFRQQSFREWVAGASPVGGVSPPPAFPKSAGS